jgi:Ca2+/Na+ antiporter
MWGPAYRGFWGKMRKTKELALKPWNLPFVAGWFCSFCILAPIPYGEQSVKESSTLSPTALSHLLDFFMFCLAHVQFACRCLVVLLYCAVLLLLFFTEMVNMEKIMEEKKARTGSYH